MPKEVSYCFIVCTAPQLTAAPKQSVLGQTITFCKKDVLVYVQGEWASDMQELETNCNSCVAAIRSQTAVLNR